MATGDNPVIPLYEPGSRITAAASAAIVAGRFVKISATLQAGPLLDVSTPTGPLVKGNLPVVAQCVAGEKAFGVAGWDASAADEVLPVINGPGMVVPVTSGAAVTAGAKIMSDAAGKAITWVSAASEANSSNGIALNTVAGADLPIFVRLNT